MTTSPIPGTQGTGYLNRVIKLDFSDEWSTDPERDPIWLVIRNPKLVPPGELTGNVAMNPDGTPVDMQQATDNMYEVVAKLVVAWRVYDATQVPEIDPVTGEDITVPELLPMPATAALCRKLPSAFITRVANEIKAAVDPQ